MAKSVSIVVLLASPFWGKLLVSGTGIILLKKWSRSVSLLLCKVWFFVTLLVLTIYVISGLGGKPVSVLSLLLLFNTLAPGASWWYLLRAEVRRAFDR